MTSTGPAELRAALNAFAVSLPGAAEEFPWGERVVKVRGKIFVFFGSDEPGNEGMTVKLRDLDANEQALALPGAKPSGYGLGKAGWVSFPISSGVPAQAVLEQWIEASYRVVAPKRLVVELDRKAR